ncbi:MAG TPA: glycosyl hydrolase [Solirubrobacteraceae bacterium]|nr:glycosyl hydrolase [Solirubrobacteraceae bacterium]
MSVGVTPTEQQDARELAAARALNAHIVRIEVRWSEYEAQPGEVSSERLSQLAAFMRAAARRRIKVIVLSQGTPCWDSTAPVQIEAACLPGQSSKANAWPPANDAAYGTFVAFIAQRFASELAAIEVWNEPDQANEDYLAGPEKAAHYAEILKAAYPAIKAVAPQIPVLAGSFIGPTGYFLRLLYEHGIQGYYDGLSVHFYTLTLAALHVIHEVQLQHHDSKPIWLTEFGWPACAPSEQIQQEQACVSARVQAENLASMTHELARLPYVAAAVFYKLQDSPEESFGVLTESGARKPSFAAVARAFANPLAKPAPVRLQLLRSAAGLIATGSAPVGDYMQLEALRDGHLRYSTLFTLDRFNRYRVALPAAIGARGLLVRVHQYGYPPRSGAHARA